MVDRLVLLLKELGMSCFWVRFVGVLVLTIWGFGLDASGLMAAEPKGAEAAVADRGSEEGERYTYSEKHDRNGIGKFYMGREIARVMSYHGIPWLERDEREEEERLSLFVEAMKFKPGMNVADVGAGSGVLTAKIAPLVGPEGKVFAVDIQQEMLDALGEKMKQKGLENVVPVLGTVKSPQLKPGTIDLAFMVDVYHEFDHPYEMSLELSRSLKPGGRLVFVEYRKEDRAVPIKEIHKMSAAQVKKEMSVSELKLKWKATLDVLPRQHILIFEKQK